MRTEFSMIPSVDTQTSADGVILEWRLASSSLSGILHRLTFTETVAKPERNKATSKTTTVDLEIGLCDLVFPDS